MHRLIRWLRRAALLLVLLSGHALADGGVSEAVQVKGLVSLPATFGPADLAKMDVREVTLKSGDTPARSYRGVLLRDLLAACKPIEKDRFDLRKSYFVARATDGYLAVFSWAEVFNSALGDGVLVAFEANGQPLTDAEGRVALVSAGDTRSGPRHVRWLESIDVRRATP